MFSLFRKRDKKPRWPPLYCQTRDIIALMEESIRIDAPMLKLIFEYKGQQHTIGLSSDYEPNRGFFDVQYYLDEEIFFSTKEFLGKAEIDSCRFIDICDKIAILEADDHEDPRNFVSLAACERPD